MPGSNVPQVNLKSNTAQVNRSNSKSNVRPPTVQMIQQDPNGGKSQTAGNVKTKTDDQSANKPVQQVSKPSDNIVVEEKNDAEESGAQDITSNTPSQQNNLSDSPQEDQTEVEDISAVQDDSANQNIQPEPVENKDLAQSAENVNQEGQSNTPTFNNQQVNNYTQQNRIPPRNNNSAPAANPLSTPFGNNLQNNMQNNSNSGRINNNNQNQFGNSNSMPDLSTPSFGNAGGNNFTDSFDSGFGSGGFGSNQDDSAKLSPSDRVGMIKEVYKLVLNRKPETRDINYYKYSTLGKNEIIVQLLEGKEHGQLMKDGKKFKKVESRAEKAEARVEKLEGQIEDQVEEFKHLSRMLEEKNKYIQQLRAEGGNPFNSQANSMAQRNVAPTQFTDNTLNPISAGNTNQANQAYAPYRYTPPVQQPAASPFQTTQTQFPNQQPNIQQNQVQSGMQQQAPNQFPQPNYQPAPQPIPAAQPAYYAETQPAAASQGIESVEKAETIGEWDSNNVENQNNFQPIQNTADQSAATIDGNQADANIQMETNQTAMPEQNTGGSENYANIENITQSNIEDQTRNGANSIAAAPNNLAGVAQYTPEEGLRPAGVGEMVFSSPKPVNDSNTNNSAQNSLNSSSSGFFDKVKSQISKFN